MKLEVKNLHKRFGRQTALDAISFSLEPGNIFGFVGPNGAGKTTTMRILSTMLDPDKGDALLDGVSILDEPGLVHRHVSFMPDSLPEYKDITVHEYIDFFGRSHGLRGARLGETVAFVENFCGLEGMREKTLFALSKGMKQRVSLGRALVNNPAILLLDEPASGLDPRARVQLRELLKVLAEQGTAILISSHILTELTEICNGVIIIESGKIIETGTFTEIRGRMQKHVELRLRPVEPPQRLHGELCLYPNLHDVRIEGDWVAAAFRGTPEAAAELIPRLFQTGHALYEFRQEQVDLEDIFMTLTKGEVQ